MNLSREQPKERAIRTSILFDLDDTVFDHQYCRRTALRSLMRRYEAAGRCDLPTLERLHEKHLQATHPLLLDGRISVDQARRERVRLLFADLGANSTNRDLDEAESLYRITYDVSRRAVPGSVRLMQELKKTMKIGIVTNGLVWQQREKIEICGVRDLIDCIVVSEEAGAKKPDGRIFEIALARLGARPEETIVVGDSWPLDVLGARAAGLRAVWLNRYGEECPEPENVVEVTSLEPVERLLGILAE